MLPDNPAILIKEMARTASTLIDSVFVHDLSEKQYSSLNSEWFQRFLGKIRMEYKEVDDLIEFLKCTARNHSKNVDKSTVDKKLSSFLIERVR